MSANLNTYRQLALHVKKGKDVESAKVLARAIDKGEVSSRQAGIKMEDIKLVLIKVIKGELAIARRNKPHCLGFSPDKRLAGHRAMNTLLPLLVECSSYTRPGLHIGLDDVGLELDEMWELAEHYSLGKHEALRKVS